jgi:hypothetical protein
MLLMIVIGIFSTFLGVALGSAILELTVRVLGNSLAGRPAGKATPEVRGGFTTSGRSVMLNG